MKLALFDFDGTLTHRDSLLPFLRHSFGTMRFAGGLLATSVPLVGYATGLLDNARAKERVLRHFLGGRDLGEVQAAGRRFADDRIDRLLRDSTMQAFARHRDAGDTCVLVSASLDVYLLPWAVRHGFEAVLCSGLATAADNTITGSLVPRNCFGPEKARRITEWLAGRVPEYVTAYGDSSGDDEMLAMAGRPIRVK